MSLTQGAIMRTYQTDDVNHQPILQIIDIKKLSSTSDRYRLVISDGQHYQQAMLATQLNSLITTQQVKEHCIVRLDEFISNNVAKRKVIIILKLSTVSDGPGHQIGNPVNVDTAAAKGVTAPPAAAAAAVKPEPTPYNPYAGSAPAMVQTPAMAQQNFHPISSLNPYQNKWTIKARVTRKSDMRKWSNVKGEGQLFSVELLDAEGGQIKATMFREAATKFFPIFQEGKVYIISKGNLKLANKRWNTLPNDYELTLNSDADVQAVQEDAGIQMQRFDFNTIEQIRNVQADQMTDVIGIVKDFTPVANIVSRRTQKELTKRTITVMDDTLLSIDVTLWGEDAERCNEAELKGNPVIVIKKCKVSDFGGKSLNASFGSQIFMNMDVPRAHELRSWYDTKGRSATVETLSGQRTGGGPAERKQLEAVKEEQLGFDKPAYFRSRATVTYFKNDMNKPPWYAACPSASCNKKVTSDNQGGWFCEKCNRSYDGYEPRYILNMILSDATGGEWATAFNEQGEQLLGISAKELEEFVHSGNEQAFAEVFKRANFKDYVFKLRCKVDTTQDGDQRQRVSLMQAQPLDFKAESTHLLAELAKM